MKKVHISPTQHSLIVALRDGVTIYFSSGIDAHAWICRRGFPRCTAGILALERKGYVERFDHTHTGCKIRLTEKANELK